MLDKHDEQLQTFCKENVVHTNDRILCEFMLTPLLQKPEEVMTSIKESKVLGKVNKDIIALIQLLLGYLLCCQRTY